MPRGRGSRRWLSRRSVRPATWVWGSGVPNGLLDRVEAISDTLSLSVKVVRDALLVSRRDRLHVQRELLDEAGETEPKPRFGSVRRCMKSGPGAGAYAARAARAERDPENAREVLQYSLALNGAMVAAAPTTRSKSFLELAALCLGVRLDRGPLAALTHPNRRIHNPTHPLQCCHNASVPLRTCNDRS